MDVWRTIAERKIREAMDEGEFQNLEGTGAPLDLAEEPFTDPSLRMAHRLLRNNGFAPAWIEDAREIEAESHRLRTDLARSGGEPEAVERFRRGAAQVNRRIASYNLRTPAAQTQKLPLDVEREIARILSR
ncbi:MAG TPA: DUF1992 domain-containing protein [Bryobacteraceae bacterium]|nr:DUF1992 domain-containing protein [Bryobacteraceae bacterium]